MRPIVHELAEQVGVETDVTMAAIVRVGLGHDFNEIWFANMSFNWPLGDGAR
jgi:hypothetical protein